MIIHKSGLNSNTNPFSDFFHFFFCLHRIINSTHKTLTITYTPHNDILPAGPECKPPHWTLSGAGHPTNT